MNNEIIKFKNVTKTYPLYHHINAGIKNIFLKPTSFLKFMKEKSYTALDDISFDIKKGDSVAIIGKNGAGKSTTLSLLTGVLKPTSGSIKVNGKVAAMLELGGGFHHELSGKDNIKLNATLLGMSKKDIDEKIADIIAFSELDEFINEPIRIYSSGMLAKLGFSVITSVKPDILVIDEVLAVGDYEFQQKCLKTINKFRANGTTIILVSHNMNDVRKFCNKVIWIEDHKVKKIGSVDEIVPLYENY